MQAARVTRLVDRQTGDIILRHAGKDRLSQAIAAGLVFEPLQSDIEAVCSENTSLKAALGTARQDAQREAHKASMLRREKLEGYLRAEEIRESRRTLGGIAYGFCCLGIAIGMSIISVIMAFIL